MLKRYQTKNRSCPLCKPHKTGRDCRWRAKELALIKEYEREKLENRG